MKLLNKLLISIGLKKPSLTIESFSALKNRTLTVTQKILDESDIYGVHDCNGAKALRGFIESNFDVSKLDKIEYSWGYTEGVVSFRKKPLSSSTTIRIFTDIDFMRLSKPCKVDIKSARYID